MRLFAAILIAALTLAAVAASHHSRLPSHVTASAIGAIVGEPDADLWLDALRAPDVVLFALDTDPMLARLGDPEPITRAAFSQAPDPNHEGHKMRPDGANCKPSGRDACQCRIASCSRDENGNVASFEMSSSCQWFCSKDRCGCHPCPDGECP